MNEDTGPFCRQQCDYWNTTTCSTSGQECMIGGVCTDSAADSAAIGGTCTTAGANCGLSGGKYTGICLTDTSTSITSCYEWCRISGSDCGTGETCYDVGLDSVGVCI